MVTRQALYSGAGCAAWGYFFLYFNLNLGSISVTPSFVGMLLFLSAIRALKEERRDLALLEPLGTLLMVWELGNWLLAWLGLSLSELLGIVNLVISLASLYFHFQLLTDFAALAAKYQPPEEALDRRFLRWRTVQTLLMTAMTLMLYLTQWFGEWWEYAVIGMAVAYLIAGLCLMMTLFALRRLFREDDEVPPACETEA